jgi:FeS assembly protein IscX
MKLTDTHQIAEALCEKFPDYDFEIIRDLEFTKLLKLIMDLEFFDDCEKNCNEKILETIQAAWLDEID